MVLATIIRLEFAYPGVGIFAGDSLQYLSMVTAHGVIMVFFMIMPLLAGAFGNFLLPTQLGVHDVAFPRLNSAAFWFLPAGLIMLANLVCVDRRYQRMNCFNIREVQSLLKKRFFVDLVNPHEFTDLLDSSMIGVKYKLNNINYINPHSLLNYKWGTKTSNKTRSLDFKPFNLSDSTLTNGYLTQQLDTLSLSAQKWNKSLYSLFYFFHTKQRLTWGLSPSYVGRILTEFFTQSFLNIKLFLLWINLHVFSRIWSFFSHIIETTTSSLYRIIRQFFVAWYNFGASIYDFLKYTEFTNFDKIDLDSIANRYDEFKKTYIPSKIKQWRIKIIRSLRPHFENFNIFFYWLDIIKTSAHTLYSQISIYLPTPRLPKFHILTGFASSGRPRFDKIFFEKYTINGKELSVKEIFGENKRFSFFEIREIQTHLSAILKGNIKENNPITLLIDNSKFDYSSISTNFHMILYFIAYFPIYFKNIIWNIYSSENVSKELSDFFYYINYWILSSFFDINFVYSIFSSLSYEKNYHLFHEAALKMIKLFSNSFGLILQVVFFDFKEFLVLIFLIFKKIIIPLYTLIADFLTFYLSFFISHTFKMFNVFSIFKNSPSFNFQIWKNSSLNKKTSHFETFDEISKLINFNNEKNNLVRFSRFTDPVFKYDYKSGDYFPKLYKEVYKQLFVSLINITNGLKTSPWFRFNNLDETLEFLNDTLETKKTNVSTFTHINEKINSNLVFYSLWLNNSHDLNSRWISHLALNQKFYNMFLTSSLQQRIYNNWRQLKFTREAWRCKMLAARHQKTLFKRYVHEDGVFWSIERNAKDLLPGWAMITPFSSRTRFTAVGKVDIGLMGVLLVLNSSIISGANFLVTYRYLSTLNNRKMRDARSFFAEGVMVTSWMMILANPMLVIGIIMLLSDRHWQTSFFDYSGGGDTVLFQHMFWFFGHPEVYIIMIPVFGFTNTILSYYLRKRVSARASLIYSMYTIAFLGFFVWGHHMYMVGLAHTTRMLFSTLTVMISVPAATKLMHWCVTLVNSAFVMELPFLFVLTFIFFFVSGGISGMYVAHTGMDILFHDTFYVIGHFHVMLAGGAMFGSFGAFYFYFPAIFGVKYSRIYAYLHYTYYLIGQLMTVIPMFWLGYAGMPRRVLDYPASLGGWHSVISAGHMLSVAGLMAFFIMIFDSIRQGKAVVRNTYGITRFNTRLSFYLYESSRLLHVQRRNLYLFKPARIINLKLNNVDYMNFEFLETTLLSYTILKKKWKTNV